MRSARDVMHAAFLECGKLVRSAERRERRGDALAAGDAYMKAGFALASGVREAIDLHDPGAPGTNVSACLLQGELETAEEIVQIGIELILPHLEPAGHA